MMGTSDLYSDAELERELELLAEDEVNQEMTQINPLPDVPLPQVSQTGKSTQLRDLEAWAQ